MQPGDFVEWTEAPPIMKAFARSRIKAIEGDRAKFGQFANLVKLSELKPVVPTEAEILSERRYDKTYAP